LNVASYGLQFCLYNNAERYKGVCEIDILYYQITRARVCFNRKMEKTYPCTTH
jgi:hypothetical protein